jgi:hypothetical protein
MLMRDGIVVCTMCILLVVLICWIALVVDISSGVYMFSWTKYLKKAQKMSLSG